MSKTAILFFRSFVRYFLSPRRREYQPAFFFSSSSRCLRQWNRYCCAIPRTPSIHSGRPFGYSSPTTRRTQTSIGNASTRPKPNNNVHSATFAPTPFIFKRLSRTSSSEALLSAERFTSPPATLRAASIIYLFLKPALSGARSSGSREASFSADGNEYPPPGSLSPKFSQSLPIIPFIRGILLF